ncbi:MAG: hypothetical protein AAF740_03715 [Bacteroidota bacterium]
MKNEQSEKSYMTPEEYIGKRLKPQIEYLKRKVASIEKRENRSFISKYGVLAVSGLILISMAIYSESIISILLILGIFSYYFYELTKRAKVDNRVKIISLDTIKALEKHLAAYEENIKQAEADENHFFTLLVTESENTLHKENKEWMGIMRGK